VPCQAGRSYVTDRLITVVCSWLAAPAITAASTGLREPQALLHTVLARLPCSTPALQIGAVHARAAGIPCEHLLRAHAADHRQDTTRSTAGCAAWPQRWLVARDLGTAAAAEHVDCADQVTLPLHCTSRVAADGIRAQ
jgi:hypothetical protein